MSDSSGNFARTYINIFPLFNIKSDAPASEFTGLQQQWYLFTQGMNRRGGAIEEVKRGSVICRLCPWKSAAGRREVEYVQPRGRARQRKRPEAQNGARQHVARVEASHHAARAFNQAARHLHVLHEHDLCTSLAPRRPDTSCRPSQRAPGHCWSPRIGASCRAGVSPISLILYMSLCVQRRVTTMPTLAHATSSHTTPRGGQVEA